MASKNNAVALLFLLLLVSGNIYIGVAASSNRKLMVEEVKKTTDQIATDQVDINNHHSIPRGSWDNGQNGP